MTNLAHLVAQGLLVLTVALWGCATCRPATIVVAARDQTARLDTGPGPMRTRETGRLEEAVTPSVAREYWVRSQEGRWHRVTLDQYQNAHVGGAVQVCE